MKVLLAYSHVDALAALRLLAWMDFIDGKPEHLLVISTIMATRTPAHKVINELLAEKYPQAERWTLPDQKEVGWPRACTHMFARSIEHAKDDIFWLEPDCVPMTSDWFKRLDAAYNAAGTVFMGRRVPSGVNHPEHMTGVAFYGKNWRSVAPDLGNPNAGRIGAWDVDQAPKTLTAFTETRLIQHDWIRNKGGAEVDTSKLEPGIALYHQCKTGFLMKHLRPDFTTDTLTSRCQLVTTSNTRTMNFYLTTNTAKPVQAAGKTFPFEPAEYMVATHSWWGTYKTDKADEIAVLDELAARGLIDVISEEDYQKLEVKKKRQSGSLNLIFSQNAHGFQESKPVPAASPAASPAAEPSHVSRMVETTEDILSPKRGRNRK